MQDELSHRATPTGDGASSVRGAMATAVNPPPAIPGAPPEQPGGPLDVQESFEYAINVPGTDGSRPILRTKPGIFSAELLKSIQEALENKKIKGVIRESTSHPGQYYLYIEGGSRSLVKSALASFNPVEKRGWDPDIIPLNAGANWDCRPVDLAALSSDTNRVGAGSSQRSRVQNELTREQE
jgi:hypothetical protein